MSAIRLEIDYGRLPWLRGRSRLVTMAWIDLLSLVKAEGPYKGAVKWRGIDDLLFAMRYGTDEKEVVEELLAACEEHGAITFGNGELVIEVWDDYQTREAERSRRRRRGCNGQTSIETVKSETTGSIAECNGQTSIETVKGQLTGTSAVSAHTPPPLDGPLPSPSRPPSSHPPLNPPSPEDGSKKVLNLPEPVPRETAVLIERFRKAFPRRDGNTMGHKAALKFSALVKAGVDPEVIIAGAARYCEWSKRPGGKDGPVFGTSLVQQQTTWLNNRCWEEPYGLDQVPSGKSDDRYRKEPVAGIDTCLKDLGSSGVTMCFAGTRQPFSERVWHDLRRALDRAPSVDECLEELGVIVGQ